MWFVSKKKYDVMVAEKNKWDSIAAESIKLCQEFREHAAQWEEVARSCHEDNKGLLALSEEMLARMRNLEDEKTGLELKIEALGNDYDVLRDEHAALCRKAEELREERDHYKQYCCYLENELLYYQGGEGEDE